MSRRNTKMFCALLSTIIGAAAHAQTFTSILKFDGTDGSGPQAALIQGSYPGSLLVAAGEQEENGPQAVRFGARQTRPRKMSCSGFGPEGMTANVAADSRRGRRRRHRILTQSPSQHALRLFATAGRCYGLTFATLKA